MLINIKMQSHIEHKLGHCSLYIFKTKAIEVFEDKILTLPWLYKENNYNYIKNNQCFLILSMHNSFTTAINWGEREREYLHITFFNKAFVFLK